jgi:aminoglycoside phosphotransferase family enzyme/predicted kinase
LRNAPSVMTTDPALVRFMLNPGSYPEPTSRVTHYETHISHVFLCDHFVYKMKKPVNFGFLDFSGLRKRHFYCVKEVELNSRLAGDVYLGIIPIFKESGAFSFIGGTGGRTVEYAVKMRVIPEDCMLDKLIQRGQPLYGELEPIGRKLARFHRDTRVYKGAKYGGYETMQAVTEENFAQIQPFCDITVGKGMYDQLTEYTRDFLSQYKRKFSARKRNGWIRDGHGDLHSQHICLSDPPIIYDCIEFNQGFRLIDILEDIAFLFMDLEYKARFDLSSRLFRSYFAEQPDGCLDDGLLRFYKIYRAVVRGKVEGFRAQGLPEGPEKEGAFRVAGEYFHLVEFYLNYHARPFNPVVFMGLSGSGKSAISRDFASQWVILRSDEIRKTMSGIRKGEHQYGEFGEGIYSSALTRDLYCNLLERAIENANQGKRVVVDATYLRKNQRRNFHQTCVDKGLNPFFVHCVAGENVLRDRIQKRMQEDSDISDAHIGILERQIQDMEEPVELPYYRVLKLNTEAELHNIINALKEFL